MKIEDVLDKCYATVKYTAATFLFNASIPDLIYDIRAIAHNKIMTYDPATLVNCRYNGTPNYLLSRSHI